MKKLWICIILVFIALPLLCITKAVDDYVYTTGYTTNSQLTLIDKASLNTNQINVGNKPTSLVTSPTSIFLANQGNQTISVIHKLTQETSTIDLEGISTQTLALDRNYIWVTNPNDSMVTQIDIQTQQILSQTPVFGYPDRITVDLKSIWISSYTRIIQIDKTTLETVHSLFFNPKNVIALTNEPNYVWAILRDTLGNYEVVQIEKSTYETVGSIALSTDTYEDLIVGPDRIWVSSNANNKVIEILRANNEISQTFNFSGGAFGLSQDNSYVWVGIGSPFNRMYRIDKTTQETVQVSTILGAQPVETGDLTGYFYDHFFSNTFEDRKKVIGKSKQNNSAQLALDYNLDTYFQMKKKKIGTIKVILNETKTIRDIRFYVHLLEENNPVKLKWKVQYKKGAKWKSVMTPKIQEISADQWVVVGSEDYSNDTLNIETKKIRLVIKNKKVNDQRHSFGISEFFAID